MQTPYRPDNKTRLPLEHYLARLRETDPGEIAERTGTPLADGRFTLTVLGEEKTVTWPDFADAGWTDTQRILFARYLTEGRRPGPRGSFVTYRDLPWGEVYDANFRGRCLTRLAGTWGARPAAFRAACEAWGGRRVESSGDAYELEFLPGLFLRFFLWEGDEEFPASAQILFSDNFPDAFAAEDRVFVCEYVLGKLKTARA